MANQQIQLTILVLQFILFLVTVVLIWINYYEIRKIREWKHEISGRLGATALIPDLITTISNVRSAVAELQGQREGREQAGLEEDRNRARRKDDQ